MFPRLEGAAHSVFLELVTKTQRKTCTPLRPPIQTTMAGSSSAPAALATALAALDRASASARQRDSYAPKLREWLRGLDDAARPIAPPAPDLRGGNEQLKAARKAAHIAATQHRKALHAAWKVANKQHNATRKKEYDASRNWKHVRDAARFKREDEIVRLWDEERERERQAAVAAAQAVRDAAAAKVAAKAAAAWRELCAVLIGCGLERLATDTVREELLIHAIMPELHGPALGLGPFMKEAVPSWREARAAPAPQAPEAGIHIHTGLSFVSVVTHAHHGHTVHGAPASGVRLGDLYSRLHVVNNSNSDSLGPKH